MYKEIEYCRICGNPGLEPILHLGQQEFTGVFPKTREEFVPSGPLELVKCCGPSDKCCGLVQLKHTFDSNLVYGHSYGYRSGLNKTIVDYLKSKHDYLLDRLSLEKGDVVIDVGSNDGTFLNFFSDRYALMGVDPIALKFRHYYAKHVSVVPAFFSKTALLPCLGGRKAKVITSISMFYDVESPMEFMRDVDELLDDDGVWLLEQSYLPSMLKKNAYDTICHEHLEYYGLGQIKWMADRSGLRIIDAGLTGLNGGSFYAVVAKQGARYRDNRFKIDRFLKNEKELASPGLGVFRVFKKRVAAHRDDLFNLICELKGQGKRIVGIGASTKGNVLLQYCNISNEQLDCIVEINEEKFGRFTPGTRIPIVAQEKLSLLDPEYALVLPWHFKDFFLSHKDPFFNKKMKIIFPLPAIEMINNTSTSLNACEKAFN